MSYRFDHVACERGFSQRVCNIQIHKYFANFYVYNALHGATLAIAPTFNMYLDRDLESSRSVLSLHRRNSLRRTLYHLHNRETYPYSSKDNLHRYLVIYS